MVGLGIVWMSSTIFIWSIASVAKDRMLMGWELLDVHGKVTLPTLD